jgi:hypothetical protein
MKGSLAIARLRSIRRSTFVTTSGHQTTRVRDRWHRRSRSTTSASSLDRVDSASSMGDRDGGDRASFASGGPSNSKALRSGSSADRAGGFIRRSGSSISTCRGGAMKCSSGGYEHSSAISQSRSRASQSLSARSAAVAELAPLLEAMADTVDTYKGDSSSKKLARYLYWLSVSLDGDDSGTARHAVLAGRDFADARAFDAIVKRGTLIGIERCAVAANAARQTTRHEIITESNFFFVAKERCSTMAAAIARRRSIPCGSTIASIKRPTLGSACRYLDRAIRRHVLFANIIRRALCCSRPRRRPRPSRAFSPRAEQVAWIVEIVSAQSGAQKSRNA